MKYKIMRQETLDMLNDWLDGMEIVEQLQYLQFLQDSIIQKRAELNKKVFAEIENV